MDGKTSEDKNRQQALLNGLTIFLGEEVAAHTQATRLVADYCVTASHVRVKHILI